MAAGLPHEAIDLRQAEPRAVPLRLGREEWLEDTRQRHRIHAAAVVCYFEQCIASRRNVESGCFAGKLDRTRGNVQASAIWHGIARIQGEVEQGAFQLPGIGQDMNRGARQV